MELHFRATGCHLSFLP